MKYIISESQSRLLKETNWNVWVRRRATEENLKEFIDTTLVDDPCFWPTPHMYANQRIESSIHEFLNLELENADVRMSDEIYEEYLIEIMSMCQHWFYDDIINYYLDHCRQEGSVVRLKKKRKK